METPGQRLKEVRQALQLPMATMGESLGLSGATISYWESGKTAIPRTGALAIQAVYGLRCEWLLTGAGPKRVEGALPSAHELAAFVGSLFDLADHLSSLGRQLRTAAGRVERKP